MTKYALYISILVFSGSLLEKYGFCNLPSNQPYIDSLKEELNVNDESESFINSVKKKFQQEENSTTSSYIEELKATDANSGRTDESTGYTEKEKAKLSTTPTGGAIEALNQGRSQLHARIEGDIRHALGVRIGTSTIRDITASAGAGLRFFNDVYGTGWAPDITFMYEFQPFHSEWFGNIGLVFGAGVAYYSGYGSFQFQLTNAQDGNSPFPATSHTKFQFFSVPLTAALDYRLNLFRVFRPFILAGPTVISYFESRNDSVSGHRGRSTGLLFSGGVAVLLDWFSKSSAWDLYAEHSVKHYYMTLEYNRISPLSGGVRFAVSGIYAGLTFEY
ncbi:MAG: hypothetical protein AABZ06_00485 [Bdellovibrionota bacterium]